MIKFSSKYLGFPVLIITCTTSTLINSTLLINLSKLKKSGQDFEGQLLNSDNENKRSIQAYILLFSKHNWLLYPHIHINKFSSQISSVNTLHEAHSQLSYSSTQSLSWTIVPAASPHTKNFSRWIKYNKVTEKR